LNIIAWPVESFRLLCDRPNFIHTLLVKVLAEPPLLHYTLSICTWGKGLFGKMPLLRLQQMEPGVARSWLYDGCFNTSHGLCCR